MRQNRVATKNRDPMKDRLIFIVLSLYFLGPCSQVVNALRTRGRRTSITEGWSVKSEELLRVTRILDLSK